MVITRIPPRRPGSPIDHKPHSPRCHFCSAQLKCEVHGGTIRSEKVECEYDPGALSRATNFDCPVQNGKAACDFSSIKSKLPGGVSSGWSLRRNPSCMERACHCRGWKLHLHPNAVGDTSCSRAQAAPTPMHCVSSKLGFPPAEVSIAPVAACLCSASTVQVVWR